MSNQLKAFANGMGSRCKIMMRAGTLCRLISLSPSEVIYYGRADEVTIEGAKAESEMRVPVRAILTRHLKRQFSLALPTVAPSERAVPEHRTSMGRSPNELRTRQVAVLEG
jgi:hypothetical protein